MRLHEHADAAASSEPAQLRQVAPDARDGRLARFSGHEPVGKHAHPGRAEAMREVDESPRLIHLRGQNARIGLVQPRRRAQVGDDQVQGTQVPDRRGNRRRAELGPFGEVHLTFESTQLDAGVP